MKNIKLFNQDCLEGMKLIPDGSVDVICTDPPYLYLKNQKLEREFDEQLFFSECKRILKDGGFIVLFGRGTSFYRWNYLLSELGLNFKEEIVWDKSHGTSPLMPINRVHETISIHSKGKGKIVRSKVPYLEMKSHDIGSVIQDVKRMRSVLKNTKSLDAVLNYLKTNDRDTTDSWIANNLSISSNITKEDRSVSVLRSFNEGMNPKTIFRGGFEQSDSFTKHSVTTNNFSAGDRDRCVKVVNSMQTGMNEKSIIKQVRDHYTSIHPTQKPVRLLERLLQLVIPNGQKDVIVIDPFSGSGSTAEACYNMNLGFIGYEIDKEYYEAAQSRINALKPSVAHLN